MKNDLSIQDKLLVAANALEEEGRQRFSAEDLVVMAWSKYPEAFGLSGYTGKDGRPLYPNSNRVYAEIMGSKPLRKNGWLRKVGSKMYQLTEAGRSHARSVYCISKPETATKWALAREQVDFIRRLFDSRAAAKFRAGQREDISFFDACGFWGISAGSNAKDLWGRFAEVESILAIAGESLSTREAVRMKHGSAEFAAGDVKTLEETHSFLQDRFKLEIEHIKARIDER
ncbi:MAG: hypothetical protein JW810_01430 [Sedimentisphaerales bacterium]|nr:hypothetical protein [Sedimentisphaerales bacterium]